MATSEIVRLAQSYKSQLERRNQYQMAEMLNRWTVIRNDLRNTAQNVADEILRLFPDGGVTENWIREFEYYRSLQEQADNVIAQYAGWSENYTYQQILLEYQLGIDEATQLLTVTGQSSKMGYFTRLGQSEIELIAGASQTGAPLGQLFATIGVGAQEQLSNALMTGLARGLPSGRIAEMMMSAFTIPPVRANMIARTEINRAHRTATLTTYQEHGVTRYKRMANQKSACMACLLLDGQIYSSADALDDHPNGACGMIPWVDGTEEPTWETGKEYFEKLPEEQQRARMGNAYYESWKRGDYKLDDLATIKSNHIWGGNPTVRPLKELSPDWKSWYFGGGADTSLDYLKAKMDMEQEGFTVKMFEAGKKLTDMYGAPINTPEIEAWITRPNIWYGKGDDGTIHPSGEIFQSQILNSGFKERTILYRGANYSQYKSIAVGEELKFEQFTSTSSSRAVANFFGEISAAGGNKNLLFVIDAPVGTKGLYVHQDAAEIVLPAGTVLKILAREGDIIFAKILGQP